ncbi:hypothetical protein [Neisseria sp.]|uniref:hypothetical protein n=1 Tax=Neisseria sp. TaxID=192066 RepID=UPI00359FA5B0
MSAEQHYLSLKAQLKPRPKQLEKQEDWLFVLGNTMRAMIENTDKGRLGCLDEIPEKRTSRELKLAFDFCQGRFGGDGFSYRRHPRYAYLSGLVATFPEFELSRANRAYLKEITDYDRYLLYGMDE